jgi:hypothetical protein
MNKFKTARGRLTAYALACGYIERYGPWKLWYEHGVFHVNGIKHGQCYWDTARTLTDARKILARGAITPAIMSRLEDTHHGKPAQSETGQE